MHVLQRLRHRILPLAGYEMLASLRSSAGMGVLALSCVAGLIIGGAEGATPGLVAYRIGRAGAIMLGFLCLPLLAAAARRDAVTLAADAVQSRPQQAHELMLARWLGNYALMLIMLVCVTLFAFAAQGVFGGPLPEGAGPRASLTAVVDAMVMGALPLVFLSVLAYSFADLLQNTIAVAIVGVYWILVLLGRDYLSRIYDLSLSQNAPVYLLLAAGVMLATMSVARLRQGLYNARKLNVPALALACLVGGALLGWHFVLTRHDPPTHASPVAQTVGGQDVRQGRLPGFWLNDQNGKRVRLHEFEGSPVVIGFWSPAVPASVQNLATLQQVHQKFGPRGARVVGICIADDSGTGGRYARETGYQFAMVTDDGTHWAPKIDEASPLTEAYDVSELPTTYVADGTRRVLKRATGPPGSQIAAITAALEAVLPQSTGN